MRLEDLQTNAAVRGVLPDALVTVVSVQWFGSEAVELTYKSAAGAVANELLYRHDEARGRGTGPPSSPPCARPRRGGGRRRRVRNARACPRPQSTAGAGGPDPATHRRGSTSAGVTLPSSSPASS